MLLEKMPKPSSLVSNCLGHEEVQKCAKKGLKNSSSLKGKIFTASKQKHDITGHLPNHTIAISEVELSRGKLGYYMISEIHRKECTML